MKNFLTIWIVLILSGGSISSVYAQEVHYDRLLTRAEFSKLDTPSVHLLQQHLADIYQNDLDWSRDVRLRQHPLTDGLIGPVTLFWLQRFVFDFKIEPVGDFTNELYIRLARIASFAGMFPDETRVLLSADFAHWNDTQPSLQKNSYYAIRRSGTDQELLDLVHRYLQVVDPVPAPLRESGQKLTTYSYQLTAEDFKLLQSKKQILMQLTKLENKHFDNFPELEEAVDDALKDYPEQTQKLLPIIKQYFTTTGITVDWEVLDRVARKLKDDPLVIPLNSIIAKLLESELSGVEYPAKGLFDKAAQAKIHAGIAACHTKNAHNQYILGLRISDDDFKALKNELLADYYKDLPNLKQNLERVESLRSLQPECDPADAEFVGEFLDVIYTQVVQPSIAIRYQKKPVFDKSLPIQWSGEGCGCVLDQLSGTVYGFYPFWLANGKMQKVNFSVLSRVAYYGLSFDEKGTIRQTNDVNNTALAVKQGISDDVVQNEFVRLARKHGSKVDWVIHNDKPYWDAWKTRTTSAKVDSFQALADNITNLLTSQLTDSASSLKHSLTSGIIPIPLRGDGVTLYFNDYPEDQDSLDLFNNFFKDLVKKLNAAEGEYVVNIMVQQMALGKGIHKYTNLLEQTSEVNLAGNANALEKDTQSSLKGKVLVLIDEPTTDSKKKLRLNVENSELYGMYRGLLLKNIIPVIEFDGRNWEQLEDDLAYFKDNFGGVGFWPLVMNEPAETAGMAWKCDDIKAVDGCLVRHFQQMERNGQPDKVWDKFVCENRWFFRMAMALFMTICLLLACAYLVSCHVRKNIRNHFILYLPVTVIPALVLALLLLTYDPALEPLSKGNLPLIIVVISVVVASIILNQRRRMHEKKPSRPKTLRPGGNADARIK